RDSPPPCRARTRSSVGATTCASPPRTSWPRRPARSRSRDCAPTWTWRSAISRRGTFEGLRTNLDVAVRYLAAWLGSLGCVPINDLMEDAATAEISRAQVWQWQRHGARLQDGRYVNAAVIQQTLSEVMASLPERVGAEAPGADQFWLAARILADLTTGSDWAEFLTTVAYDYLD